MRTPITAASTAIITAPTTNPAEDQSSNATKPKV
jgi:hypothetical protein